VAAGVSPDASLAAVNRVIADFPSVQVKDQAQYKQDQACQINQVLVLFYLLPVAAGFRGGARITVYCGPVRRVGLVTIPVCRSTPRLRGPSATRDTMHTIPVTP
jgi:hypothetical protein